MKNTNDIKQLLDDFKNTQDTSYKFDEQAIVSAYEKDSQNQSLSIKILSIFGGVLASLTFVGFLFLVGIFDSKIGPLLFGAIFITIAILINKTSDEIIIDTISVSSYIIGFILIAIGCGQLNIDENTISIIFIAIALGSLVIVQNYLLSFVSVLIINGSILTLIIANKSYDLLHLHVCCLALALTYFLLKEATIITSNKIFSKLYNPVKIALVFSLLSGLLLLGKKEILPVSINYIWLSSIVTIALIVYVFSSLFTMFNISKPEHKIAIYLLTVLALLPTALSPAILGAILIIFLSFLVNYKTGFVIGVISFIYFVYQYYYDLNFTLLTKSILLFSTGIIFIALYLLTHKKLTAHEKV